MASRFLLKLVFAFLAIACLEAAEPLSRPKLNVPNGFIAEQVAGAPECVFPMFATFDDRGRLFVAESSGLDLYAELTAVTRKCRVRLLEDADGDGRFDRSRIFADGLVFPMGLVWREEKLFVADPPDLAVYTDRDGDGRADERKVLLTGFGHRDNGSLHGLTFGPDGFLYMTMGDPDGFHLKGPDGSTVNGETGALIRCRADGSQLEVVSWGFVNLVEVIFTPRGEIIGTDNWFQLPSGGIRDALVHLVEGGVYPLNSEKGGDRVLTGDVLPPVSLFPAVALSGLVRYRGLSFPELMRGSLFSAQHNARRVGCHQLVRKGATFESRDEGFLTSDDPDFHPSDVLEDADGSLLIVDTGGWYVQHCPTGKIRDSQAPGGIYRVRRLDAKPVSDPWGKRIAWANQTSEELAQLLADARPAVSDRAQQTIVARGAASVPLLSKVLQSGQEPRVKQDALWILAALEENGVAEELRKTLIKPDPEMAAIAMRVLARRRDTAPIPQFERILSSADATLQLGAAEALMRCGTKSSLPALWRALTNAPDGFVRHAVVYAIHELADRESLEFALGHENPRVQAAALWLLDQRSPTFAPKDAVLQRLAASDLELAKTALQVLKRHKDWVDAAAEYARAALSKPVSTNNGGTRLQELLLAFQSQSPMHAVIAEYLNRPDPSAIGPKLFLLETIRQMSLQRVPPSWIQSLSALLSNGGDAIRRGVLRVLATWQLSALDSEIAAIADEKSNRTDLRLEALGAIVSRQSQLPESRFGFLLSQISNDQEPLTRLAAGEILGRCRLSLDQKNELLKRAHDEALISPTVLLAAVRQGEIPGEASSELLSFLKSAIQRGWRFAESDLELVLAKLPKAFEAESEKLRAFLHESQKQERARLRSFEPLLIGGSKERGRVVFFNPKSACSTCHRVAGQGGSVGPDLTKIGAIRSGSDLLESIIVPSSTFAQGYESYSLVLKDGREADGIIARQNADSVVLRDSSGGERQFRNEQIAELKRRMISIMPEGLENMMSSEEFGDLLAFLQGLK